MDTFYLIDYVKSLEKQRLTYKMSMALVFDYVFACFIALIVITLISIPTFLPNISDFIAPVIIKALVLGADVWMIFNLILLNAFVRIEGRSKEVNQVDIIAILSDTFELRNLDQSIPNIFRDFRPISFADGRVMTC